MEQTGSRLVTGAWERLAWNARWFSFAETLRFSAHAARRLLSKGRSFLQPKCR
jgi:hypothetical protein